MIPRAYQAEAADAARAALAEHGSTLLALPTGAGKTVTAGLIIADEALADPSSRFVLVQHTEEMIHENKAATGSGRNAPGHAS